MIELSMSQCFIELDGNISSISDRNNALKKLSKHPKIFSSLSSLNKSLSEVVFLFIFLLYLILIFYFTLYFYLFLILFLYLFYLFYLKI